MFYFLSKDFKTSTQLFCVVKFLFHFLEIPFVLFLEQRFQNYYAIILRSKKRILYLSKKEYVFTEYLY
ncbi:hypothetical protein B0A68_19015 [Flavobacterium reichenbachii]|uniref:Uncharacterized protein n=1 Tax=Flavobacterium reichenbachii TaxID=362418 RepID=A0A085ZLU0_9FLAO|nr:hypothetical protein IW19_07615 [Flavobacterium reichenbachii]OXB12330.1 hypothetical protein B0A68_19015 [Flavobacterium reichenbachii]